MSELPIHGGVTRDQVQQWAANLPKAAQIRTKTDGEGRTVLYAKLRGRLWQLFHKTGRDVRMNAATEHLDRALHSRSTATSNAPSLEQNVSTNYSPVPGKSPETNYDPVPGPIQTGHYTAIRLGNVGPGQSAQGASNASAAVNVLSTNDASPNAVKKDFDRAVAAQINLDGLPKTLRESPEFKSAVIRLGEALKEDGIGATGHAASALGRLIGDALRSGSPALQKRLALSDAEPFLNSLLLYAHSQTKSGEFSPLALLQAAPKSLDRLPKEKAAMLTGVFDLLVGSLADHALPPDDANADRRIVSFVLSGVKYVPQNRLGGGNFGDVYKYVAANPGQLPPGRPAELAVKIPKYNKSSDDFRDVAVNTPLKEARTMVNAVGTGASAYAGNLLKFEGTIRNADGAVLVATRLEKGGTAASLIDNAKTLLDSPIDGHRITEDQYKAIVLTLLKDAIEAGARLQTGTGIIHYDLKADNWLLTADGRVQIADMGLARRIGDEGDVESRTIPGVEGNKPIGWTAPEVLNQDPASSAADVWTLGIVFYEFLTGKGMMTPGLDHPALGWTGQGASATHATGTNRDIATKVVAHGGNSDSRLISQQDVLKFPRLAGYVDLINTMLHPDPAQRPTFEQILKNPAFTQPEIGSSATRGLIGQIIGNQLTPPSSQQLQQHWLQQNSALNPGGGQANPNVNPNANQNPTQTTTNNPSFYGTTASKKNDPDNSVYVSQ